MQCTDTEVLAPPSPFQSIQQLPYIPPNEKWSWAFFQQRGKQNDALEQIYKEQYAYPLGTHQARFLYCRTPDQDPRGEIGTEAEEPTRAPHSQDGHTESEVADPAQETRQRKAATRGNPSERSGLTTAGMDLWWNTSLLGPSRWMEPYQKDKGWTIYDDGICKAAYMQECCNESRDPPAIKVKYHR